jgi:AcrR family transcriptional regulator
VEQAIFDAVHRMLERGSRLGDLTTDRIAQEAGVGKATLYRRWPNRDALLLDLVVRLDEQLPELPGRDIRQDLVALVDFMRRRGLAKRARGLLSLVLGEMAASPELYRMYRERVVVPRKQAVQDVLERGMAEGTIRADIDVRLLGELVMGPILIRALLDENAPLGDPELSEQIVDAALRGIAAAVPVRGK